MRSLLVTLGLLSAVTLLAASRPALPPPGPDPAPSDQIGPEMRRPALDLSDEIRALLRAREWSAAADALIAMGPDSVVGDKRGDWAFLVTFCLLRAERQKEAATWIPLIEGAPDVPASYALLVRGEVLRATGDLPGALALLEKVPVEASSYGRATVQRAETLRELGRTKEAFDLYEMLAARPDPASGTPEALLALGQRSGADSPEGYAHLRRLWAEYPGSESSAKGDALLAAVKTPGAKPTWQETGRRAEILMERGQYASALALTEPYVTAAKGDGLASCRFAYVRGRSFYRSNQLSNAITAFGDQGERCVDGPEDQVAEDYGAKILYLKGQAHYRKREFTTAAKTFGLTPDLYPETTFADDGLTQAGIALQEAGDLPGAQAMWRRALTSFADGDTAPEASWRLAFSLYLEGKPDDARAIALELGALPLAGDAVHVAAGRYWAARWALYPNVEAPTVPSPSADDKALAVREWKALCEDLPHSYYAILAWSRLSEEAPEVAAALAARPAGHAPASEDDAWVVRSEFLAHPGVADGTALARLGLVRDGITEWSSADLDHLTGSEMAWLTELRIRGGDWLFAHDDMRKWLRTHPPGTLGPQERQVLRIAYPDRYWAEVQVAAKDDRFEPRLLHALVREESNFNTSIVSHAGAIGLSQLMPGTAKEVAGWLKRPVGDLNDPANNLEIGARYLDSLAKKYQGNPFLTLAAYNAGGGRVDGWLAAWGNVPADEYNERIPFKETRDYVKRVTGTWQTMRYEFDGGDAYADVSAFNHRARPE